MSLAWLAYILPITLTPGPVNITAAAISMRFDPLKSVPFLAAVNLVNVFYCLACAWGLEVVVAQYPGFLNFLKIVGALFIVYMAYMFYLSGNDEISLENENHRPKFKEGLLINILNIKTILVFSVTFAQFCSVDGPFFSTPLALGVGTILICMASQASWVLGGKMIAKIWGNNTKLLARVCSISLLGVALWIVFNL